MEAAMLHLFFNFLRLYVHLVPDWSVISRFTAKYSGKKQNIVALKELYLIFYFQVLITICFILQSVVKVDI